MDLRLIGLWRADIRLETILRLLRPVAAFGAGLAIVAGALLFAVQARDYVRMPLFAAKITLVVLGLAHALSWGDRSPPPPAAASAAPAPSRSRSGSPSSWRAACSATSERAIPPPPAIGSRTRVVRCPRIALSAAPVARRAIRSPGAPARRARGIGHRRRLVIGARRLAGASIAPAAIDLSTNKSKKVNAETAHTKP